MDATQAVKLGRTLAEEVYEEEVALLKELARIPAPSGHEDERATYVARWLRDAGAPRVEVDEAKNVLCWVCESDGAPVEVFSAHSDVVFDDRTPLPLREEGARLYCPGVGDDTANLVGLLMATRHLLAHPELVAGRSVLVVANSCEEGLGNLRGTRAVYERLGARIGSHVAFDLYLGGCVDSAVGSLRWRVSCDTPGGHSYGDYGTPNAIAELCALVCELEALELPAEGRCTRNAGTIAGGTTVNAIAAHAELLYEFRSASDESLRTLRAAFEAAVARRERTGVHLQAELIGERPGNGDVDPQALDALVARNAAVLAELGYAEPDRTPASTDVNVPLSLGIPAVCVGSIVGAELHTRGEWVETASLRPGLAAIVGMMLAD
jgi:acetylornithine deacetylase/succinyl-diaminopimelate desuccinylase-like protein